MPLGHVVQRQLVDIVSTLQRQHGVAASKGVRWADLTTAHITVRFLGSISDTAVDNLRQRLALVATSLAPFHIGLANGGVFRARQRGNDMQRALAARESAAPPQTLFLKVTDGLAEFERFRFAIDSTCALLGHGKDLRTSTPHVTLGRVKQPLRVPEAALQRLAQAVESLRLPQSLRVEVPEVWLVSSDREQHDSAGRPVHTFAAVWLLQAGLTPCQRVLH